MLIYKTLTAMFITSMLLYIEVTNIDVARAQNFFIQSNVSASSTTIEFYQKEAATEWRKQLVKVLPRNENLLGLKAGYANGIGIIKWKQFDEEQDIMVTYLCNLDTCERVHRLPYEELDIDIFSSDTNIYYMLGSDLLTIYKRIDATGKHVVISEQNYKQARARLIESDYSRQDYCSDLNEVLSHRTQGDQIFWQNPHGSLSIHDMSFTRRCGDE